MSTSRVVTNGDGSYAPNQSDRVRAVGNVQTRTQAAKGTPANDARFDNSSPQTPEELYARTRNDSNDLNSFYEKTKAREEADKRALKEFEVKNRNAARGIQNTQTHVAQGYTESVSPEIEDETVEGQFAKKKSVAARAYARRTRAQQGTPGATDNISEDEARRFSLRNLANTARRQHALRQKFLAQKSASSAVRKKLAQSSLWWSIVIVSTAGIFQTLFAFMTWVGYGLHFYAEDSLVGKVVSVFVDLKKYSPAIYLGHISFGLCLLISIVVFFSFLAWFTLVIKAPVLNGPAATFATITCFFFSLVPFPLINLALIPWVIYWSLYINVKGLFNT